ncbi:hypothetical protein OG806_25870 [Streptomyces sp. NBC_00882]|uniref:hypothetical protein n=1 Tax=Streptomyces TaxID=1883 RepID=UPI00386D4394|nr:hypothetical protein OG806_25870 [Streptomyces sp. NBC_00882]WSZ59572.1 hypothetical protein OH824_24950 [Streptomyces canus]
MTVPRPVNATLATGPRCGDPYTWTLTVTPADGQGADLTRTGTLKLTGAASVHRDFVGSDGFGELLTLSGR